MQGPKRQAASQCQKERVKTTKSPGQDKVRALPKRFKVREEYKKCQRRDESIHKTDPARMATSVIIPTNPAGLKPRAPEGVLVADGLATDPVDEGLVEDPKEDDEELPELLPVALSYGDGMWVTEKNNQK
jgi:hypothetical protein